MSFAYFESVPELPPVDEIVRYLAQLNRPAMADQLAEADRSGVALIQPRSGVGPQRKMIALLDVLNRPATANCLTLTIDSYTRLVKFDTAKRLLMQAAEQLNGYPLVAHGYRAVREITNRYARPIVNGDWVTRAAFLSFLTSEALIAASFSIWLPLLVGWLLPVTLFYQAAVMARLVVEHH